MYRLKVIPVFVLAVFGLSVGQNNTLAPFEEEQGFELMFDGTSSSFRDLFADYQRGNTTSTSLNSGWSASNGVISNGSANRDIRTRRMYRDFDWRLEYRNPGNQGIIYRFTADDSYTWSTGIEFAIDDNLNQEAVFTAGAAYDLLPPKQPNPYRRYSTGEWNKVRLVVKGDSVEHWMNDELILAFRYWGQSFLAAYPESKWTRYPRFCQTESGNRTYIPEGYIGFQADHGGTWELRNMRILHDSLPTQDRVEHGPVDSTTVSVSPNDANKTGIQVGKVAQGLTLGFDPALNIQSVEIYGLNGKIVRVLPVKAGSSRILLKNGDLPTGLFPVRLKSKTTIIQDRIFIQ